jgi:hypothetical protein
MTAACTRLSLAARRRMMEKAGTFPSVPPGFIDWWVPGDRDAAIPVMRAAVDHLFCEGQLLLWGVPATGVLVETLLDRGSESDVVEAEAVIERLAAAPANEGLVIRDIWLLRLRALLARAHGDATAYAQLRDRYRDMAKTLGFEGHIAWAEAVP